MEVASIIGIVFIFLDLFRTTSIIHTRQIIGLLGVFYYELDVVIATL